MTVACSMASFGSYVQVRHGATCRRKMSHTRWRQAGIWDQAMEAAVTALPQQRLRLIISEFQKFCLPTEPNQFSDSHRPVPQRGVAQRHQRWECDAVDAGGAFDEWRCSGRRSRVVLTPRCWRQVCEKKRR